MNENSVCSMTFLQSTRFPALSSCFPRTQAMAALWACLSSSVRSKGRMWSFHRCMLADSMKSERNSAFNAGMGSLASGPHGPGRHDVPGHGGDGPGDEHGRVIGTDVDDVVAGGDDHRRESCHGDGHEDQRTHASPSTAYDIKTGDCSPGKIRNWPGPAC